MPSAKPKSPTHRVAYFCFVLNIFLVFVLFNSVAFDGIFPRVGDLANTVPRGLWRDLGQGRHPVAAPGVVERVARHHLEHPAQRAGEALAHLAEPLLHLRALDDVSL